MKPNQASLRIAINWFCWIISLCIIANLNCILLLPNKLICFILLVCEFILMILNYVINGVANKIAKSNTDSEYSAFSLTAGILLLFLLLLITFTGNSNNSSSYLNVSRPNDILILYELNASFIAYLTLNHREILYLFYRYRCRHTFILSIKKLAYKCVIFELTFIIWWIYMARGGYKNGPDLMFNYTNFLIGFLGFDVIINVIIPSLIWQQYNDLAVYKTQRAIYKLPYNWLTIVHHLFGFELS